MLPDRRRGLFIGQIQDNSDRSPSIKDMGVEQTYEFPHLYFVAGRVRLTQDVTNSILTCLLVLCRIFYPIFPGYYFRGMPEYQITDSRFSLIQSGWRIGPER